MRYSNLIVCTAVFTATLFSASAAWAQGPGATRFGVWDNSTNPNNVMTYEPHGNGGMKITVSDPRKPEAAWSYTTMFDGKFVPVHNQQNSETAVEVINDKSTRIHNKRNGVVYQVVINTLSEEKDSINNETFCMYTDCTINGVTHLTYIRLKK